MFIDTHTHLYSEEFNADRHAKIKEAMDKGVSRFYMPNVDSTSIEGMLQLEVHFPTHCFPMMGLHPCSVKDNYREELEIVKKWRDKTHAKEQELVFKEQIYWAMEYDYPIVIHCRNAFDEIFHILRSYEKLPK